MAVRPQRERPRGVLRLGGGRRSWRARRRLAVRRRVAVTRRGADPAHRRVADAARRSSARPGRRPSSRRPRRSSPTCPATPPLPPIVTPLGHESSPSAPAGLVVAHPRAVPSLTSSAPLPGRPVQRHAAGGEPASTPAPDWEAEDAPVVSRQAEAAPAGATSPSPSTAAAAPELPPIRTVPAVAPSAVATPASRPLTQTAPALAPLSSGRSGGASPSAESGRSRPQGVGLPIQASGRVPRSASPSPTATPDAVRAPLAPVRRFAELPVEAPAPPVQREATGHRRAGLGAPLPAAPDSAVVERLPMRPGPAAPKAVSPASPAPSSVAVSRLSDGTHDVHDPAQAIVRRVGLPRSPAAGPAGRPPAPGRHPCRLGNSQPVGRIPSRCGERGTVGRPARPDGLPVRRPDPAHGRRPAPAPGRDPDAGRAGSLVAGRRRRTRIRFGGRGPDARRRTLGHRRHAAVHGHLAPRVPPHRSPICRSSSPRSARRRGQASMPQAANGAREIVFPPRDGGGEPPRGRRAASLRRRRRPRSVHPRRPGPRR